MIHYTRDSILTDVYTVTDPYPILYYTLGGAERSVEFNQYDGMMPAYEISYEIGDVTDDGTDDVVVSIYIVGNTLSEAMQDTYVYTVNTEINALSEVLFLPFDGVDGYSDEYEYNVGAHVGENGGLLLEVCAEKNVFDAVQCDELTLRYIDDQWIAE